MSNEVGSSADSSAAAWMEATIAAAESYAQAEADAAADARDQAERNAASGNSPGDHVAEPPSAEQRALDAFWGNDPNRPASTVPNAGGGDDGGGSRVSVQLTPEEAKAMADAGMSVTSDGNGGYYLDANQVESVSVTQQAEPDRSGWLPGPGGGSTPVANQPAPQPEATKPAEEAKPTEEAKPAEETKSAEEAKKKHPVKDVDKLQNLDPEFRKKAEEFVEKMQEKGWKMRVVWATRTKEENDVLVDRGTASKTSKHLDGKGVDLINRADPYPDDKNHPYYKDMEAVAKEVGVTWGGDFKSRWDPTHFEAKE